MSLFKSNSNNKKIVFKMMMLFNFIVMVAFVISSSTTTSSSGVLAQRIVMNDELRDRVVVAESHHQDMDNQNEYHNQHLSKRAFKDYSDIPFEKRPLFERYSIVNLGVLTGLLAAIVLLLIFFNALTAMTSLQGPDRFEDKKK